ncbi:endonuclease domain-containing protein [Collimonas humicola]|uniref:endonuclease domain-containing protein n=1 Tax=Collimonas humicola TaxID=2825886 RepID=UPI001E62EEE9|nr:endonuclease domain-containing protein [Collimonas humicola]
MSKATTKGNYQFSQPAPAASKRPRRPRAPSAIEELFNFQVRALKLPSTTREHKFHPVRKWRIDFAWPGRKLAVEIEGGIWTQGRHTRGAGVRADMEKYNALSCLGWTLLRFDGFAVTSGTAIQQVKQFLLEKNSVSHEEA